jgi:hypothetical protein
MRKPRFTGRNSARVDRCRGSGAAIEVGIERTARDHQPTDTKASSSSSTSFNAREPWTARVPRCSREKAARQLAVGGQYPRSPQGRQGVVDGCAVGQTQAVGQYLRRVLFAADENGSHVPLIHAGNRNPHGRSPQFYYSTKKSPLFPDPVHKSDDATTINCAVCCRLGSRLRCQPARVNARRQGDRVQIRNRVRILAVCGRGMGSCTWN